MRKLFIISGQSNFCKELLKVSKTEIKAFIREFERITDNYINMVNANVSAIVVHPDLKSRMSILKNFL